MKDIFTNKLMLKTAYDSSNVNHMGYCPRLGVPSELKKLFEAITCELGKIDSILVPWLATHDFPLIP